MIYQRKGSFYNCDYFRQASHTIARKAYRYKSKMGKQVWYNFLYIPCTYNSLYSNEPSDIVFAPSD